MGTGLGINTSDVLIKILIDLNHPGPGKIFFTGGRYNPWSWCLLSKFGGQYWEKIKET